LNLKLLAHPGHQSLKNGFPLLLHAVHPAHLLGKATLVALQILLEHLESAVEATIQGDEAFAGFGQGGERISPRQRARCQNTLLELGLQMGREGLGQSFGPHLLLSNLLFTQNLLLFAQNLALAGLQGLVFGLEVGEIVFQGLNIRHEPLLAVLQIGNILRQLGRNFLA
jgi:hypothetical protein